jgi:transposase-like protein
MDKNDEWIEPRRRQVRRSPAQIDELVELYRGSGKTQHEFAAEHGINAKTMRGWLYRRRGPQPGKSMVPVRLIDSGEAQASVTIRLPGGVEVVFHAPVPVSVLQALVQTGRNGC